MFKKYLPSLYDGIIRALPQRRGSRRAAPRDSKALPTSAADAGAIATDTSISDAQPTAERSAHASQPAKAYQKLAEALKQHGMLAEAAAYYRKAIELNGSRTAVAPALVEQAAAYCAEERWQAAIATCEQAVQLEPTAEAYRLWGNALRAVEQLDAAQDCYRQAIALQPDWAELHGNLGSLHAQQQQWEDAIACYQTAIALKPDFAGAYRNLARVWTHLEQTDAAHQCWYQALTLEPEQVSASEHVNFGNLLLKQDQIEQAIVCYRHAIELDPTIGGAYQNLAEALSRQGKWEEATNYYRKAIALSVQPRSMSLPPLPTPWQSAATQLQQAESLAAQADWEAAVVACEQAMAQFEPQAIAAYRTWGNALYAQGRAAEAIRCYRWLTQLQPEAAEEHANLGSLYAQQRQWEDAIACYQTAIALKPDFAGAYRNLARVWQQVGDATAAADCWYQAFTLEPDHAAAAEHWKLGQTLLAQGKPQAAIACYRRAIDRGPQLDAAFEQLGAVLEQQNDWQAAIACYRQAVAEHPQAATFHSRLGELLIQQQQWQEAIACYRAVAALEPHAVLAHRRLGELLIQQQQWQEAIACYQRLIELEPDVGQHYHQLGDAQAQQRQWQQAVDAYHHAIRLDPQFCWSHNNLGDALLQLQQWEAAAAALQQAIALNPGFHWSHYNLGEALAQLGDWAGAIAAYRHALHLHPDLPYAPQKLGDALLQQAKQNLAEALACYRQAIRQQPEEVQTYHKAIELKPDDADLYLGLGNALAKQNQLNGAIVFYQMALQLQPQDPEVALQLARVLARQNQPASADCNPLDDAYIHWQQQHTPRAGDLQKMTAAVSRFTYQPLISVVMPVYNPAKSFLEEAIQSVLQQVYPHWELCVADDASTLPHVRATLEAYAAQDARIRVVFRSENGHISACSNTAIAVATGEFICLLDHDDVLAPQALFEVVSLLNQHPEADMIYSDEDKLDVLGNRTSPFFKPDWCPEALLSRMYTCHLGTYRRSLIEQIGGFRLGYEGAQDWDLVLRLTEQTSRIFHLPQVLYHWRSHPGSTAGSASAKTYAYQAAEKALADALVRRGEAGRVIGSYKFPGWYTVRYEIAEYRQVSILIPTRNLGKMLDQCLKSIFEKSTYPNYEVVLIDNGSDEAETAAVIRSWQQREPQRFRCCPLDIPFNYARINNFAAQQARGDYLLFLNNDTEVISPDWIEAMVEQAQRSPIGAVGALLLYPDRSIQHAGVVMGIGEVAGHSHKHADANQPGYFGQTVTVNNYAALTGACLMCQRSRFEQVGGFDEQLAVAYNDVDLCLKLMQQGYRNVYVPHAVLYHHESKSRGYEDTPAKQQRYQQEVALMQQRWRHVIERDPCYSPHLSKRREDYGLNLNTQIEVLSVTAAEQQVDAETGEGRHRWHGFIDSPAVGTVFDVTCLCIRGWVLSNSAPAAQVEVLCRDEVIQTTAVNLHRPDVAAVYAIAGSEFSGYQTQLKLSTVPPEADLQLQVVLEDGTRLPLGRIQLQHTVAMRP